MAQVVTPASAQATAGREVNAEAGDEPEQGGQALMALIQIVDRLRSPGGCPWDAEQTHRTLAPYLLEEAYELLDAIESGSVVDLREELGDVLFQVLFHARLAEELPPGERFDLDDVAADLGAKLIRRHPHVFADAAVLSPADVEANWDKLKHAEKQRTSVTDGVPTALPALALAAKLSSRARRGGVEVSLPDGTSVGARLFALALEAAAAGVDPELALRATALEYAQALRHAEGV